MRLKYEVVKGLCQLMTRTRIKIRDTKNILLNVKRLNWSNKRQHLTLKDYQYHFTDFCNTPNTLLLDEVIHKLDELVKSKSKVADYDELKSDIEWLKEYYEKESWNDVTRWLTNIDSTLRETFSRYVEVVKNIKK
jgi:hypothetical protein